MCVNKQKEDLYQTINPRTLEEKLLFLTAIETNQDRYSKQVSIPFITQEEEQRIFNRLNKIFKRNETVQQRCQIDFSKQENDNCYFSAIGMVDVIKNNVVYELKFVYELSHIHFLQCASYLVATGLKKGILWNVRDNKKFEITIPDREVFLDSVARTITKHELNKYYTPKKGISIYESHSSR
jgi:hypothetical protein